MAFANYLKYYFHAKTKYQIHSPFVFDFVENILEDTRYYYYFDAIEQYRKTMTMTAVTIKDRARNSDLSIKNIAQQSVISKETGQLLFRLVNYYKPKYALEIGTSIGLTTLYESTPSRAFSLTTFEDNIALSQFTQQQLEKMGLSQATFKKGINGKEVLATVAALPQLDYVMLNDLLPKSIIEKIFQKCSTNAAIIVQRPYGSGERTAYWEWLKQHLTVPLTLDLYDLGIAFPKAEQKQKTHFNLIKYTKKPWAMFW